MPTTRSGRDTSSPQKPEITIHNIKKESVTPPRFPFSETPPWMNSQLPPTQPKFTDQQTRKNPPRESTSRGPNYTLCPANQVSTCHCSGLRIVIPPPSPSIPPCPKDLRQQTAHWDLTIKHKQL